MGRTILSKERKKSFKEENLGHMIIYCEGQTEKFYFEYFIPIIAKSKYDDIIIEVESASGNASRVFKYALNHLSNEENNRSYKNYNKYLVFDCDAPENIQEIIQEIDSCPVDFKLLLSNRMFEVWLLMHFEDVEVPLTKAELMERLSRNLGSEYKKANQGILREIFSNGDVNAAIENAERIIKKFDRLKKYVTSDINEMNPYTNLGKLIEQLVGKISL